MGNPKLTKYASGAELSSIYSLSGNILGNAIDNSNTNANYNLDSNPYNNSGRMIASNAFRYAGQGAAIGSTINPVLGTAIGAGVGAIGGAVFGAVQNNKLSKEYEIWKKNTLKGNINQGISNYQGDLAMGFNPKGNRYASYPKGGQLPTDNLTPNYHIPLNKTNLPIIKKPVTLFSTLIKLADPTGMSEWEDLEKTFNNSKSTNFDKAFAILQATPLLGKLGKISRLGKSLNTLTKANDIMEYINTYPDGGSILENKPKLNYLPIDYNRPKLDLGNGNYATENKKIFQFDDSYFILPTVVNGKQLSDDEAISYFNNTGEHMGEYKNLKEAERASKLRTFIYNNIPQYAKGGKINRYALGGFTPNYEVEKGEVIQGNDVNLTNGKQVSNNMHLATDYTHNDKNPDTGGTGVYGSGGNRVFSNRSTPSEMLLDSLKALKIPVKKNDTHANIVLTIAKNEAKFEKGLDAVNFREKNTAKIMLERYSNAKELVFLDQELQKGNVPQQTEQYAKGGKLPRYEEGVEINPNRKIYLNFSPRTSIQSMYGETPIQDTLPKSNNITYTPIQIPRQIPVDTDIAKINDSEFGFKGSNRYLSDNWGTIANTMNLANNLISINKIKPFTNPKYPVAPRLQYNTNLPYNIYENARAAKSALINMNRFNPNSSNRYAINANLMDANNKAFMEDNMRRGEFNNQVAMSRNAVDNQRIAIDNQIAENRLNLENEKIMQRNNAVNVWATGEMQNKFAKDQLDLGRERTKMEFMGRYGNVGGRYFRQYTDAQLDELEKTFANNPVMLEQLDAERNYRSKK